MGSAGTRYNSSSTAKSDVINGISGNVAHSKKEGVLWEGRSSVSFDRVLISCRVIKIISSKSLKATTLVRACQDHEQNNTSTSAGVIIIINNTTTTTGNRLPFITTPRYHLHHTQTKCLLFHHP